MKITRILLASLLVAGATLVAGPGNAAPAQQQKAGPVALAGTTVIRGRTAGAINVHVPTPAVWSGSAKDVTITGGGETPGFLLTKSRKETYEHPILGPIEYTYQDIVASGTRLPARGVTKKWSAKDRTLLMMPGEETIKPGDYKLYLIAEGKPVKITLTLKGLLGSTQITPRHERGLDMKLLPGRTKLDATAQGLYTAGDDDVLESTGLVFDAMVVEIKDSSEGEIGSCTYRGGPRDEEQGEVVSYGPHCIGAMPDRDYISTSFHWTGNLGSRYMMMYGYTSGLDADRWTVSSWYRGSGTVIGGNAYGYWLNLE